MRQELRWIHSVFVPASIRNISTRSYTRWPHVPEKHTPEMRVDVERLRLEAVLSQPAMPPQYDSSPRRLPVIGTGPYEPGVSRTESQSTEREGAFPLQASVDGVLHVSYTRPEQECILHQVDVGANVQKTMNSEKVVAREKFARPSKKRQQQRRTSWTTEQSKQLGNDQKQKLPMLLWPKTGVLENNSGIEYFWPYLIGPDSFSLVFDQKRPGASDFSYFAQFPSVFGHYSSVFGDFMSLSGGLLELTRTDRENMTFYPPVRDARTI